MLRDYELDEIHKHYLQMKSRFNQLIESATNMQLDCFIRDELAKFNSILAQYQTGISFIVRRTDRNSYEVTGSNFASCCGMYVLENMEEYLKRT